MKLRTLLSHPALLGMVFFLATCSGDDKQDSNHGKTNTPPDSAAAEVAHEGPIYSIQVAAFRNFENASQVLSKFEESRLPTYFVSDSEPNLFTLYRVRVGPYHDQAAALEALKTVVQLGFTEAYLITQENGAITVEMPDLPEEAFDIESSKRLLTETAGCRFPRWSPSGREIGFFKGEGERQGIYTVGTGGGHASKIIGSTNKRQITPKFAWSPKGDRIALVVREVNEDWEASESLYVIDKNGVNLRRLFRQNNFSFQIENLKWSPDGRHIAFNANYGRPYPEADRIQRVLVVETRKVSESTRNVLDPSQLEKTNWLAGWRSNSELLFLSSYEDWAYPYEFTYEVRTYDLNSRSGSLKLSGPVVKNCLQIELLANGATLVYSTFEKTPAQASDLIAVDLSNGSSIPLLNSKEIASLSAEFLLTASNRIYVSLNSELWRSDIPGERNRLGVRAPSHGYTLSPDGRKICIADNGQLFMLDIPEKKSPTAERSGLGSVYP